MANPYKNQAYSSNKSKFKAMTGKSSGGQGHPDAKQDEKMIAAAMSAHDKQLHGGKHTDLSTMKSKTRLDKRARGGAVGKKGNNVTVNIVTAPKEEEAARPMPVPVPIPAGPPPGGPPPGPGPGIGGPPPMGPPPGGPMPMMRKTGGRVKMTAGADTGEGRLQKARAAKH